MVDMVTQTSDTTPKTSLSLFFVEVEIQKEEENCKTAARIRLHKYVVVGGAHIHWSNAQIEYTFSALEMNNNTDANATYLNSNQR